MDSQSELNLIEHYKRHLTKPWQQTILNWAEANGIVDVRAYPWDCDYWTLGWPPYKEDTLDTVIRQITIYIKGNQLNIIPSAFTNHRYPPLRHKASESYIIAQTELNQLERILSSSKQYADSLREEDLMPSP